MNKTGTAVEAIDVARREIPDLIVLDLMMPDVNGFEVVDALGADPATAAIPVVIVTAAHITAAERAQLEPGVATVMGKAGFDGERFVAEVRRAMGRASLEA